MLSHTAAEDYIERRQGAHQQGGRQPEPIGKQYRAAIATRVIVF